MARIKDSFSLVDELLFRLFVNRDDVFARQKYNHLTKKKYFVAMKEPLTLRHISEHLKNQDFIGVYQLDKNSHVKWGCLDFDKNTNEDHIKAKMLYHTLLLNGINVLAEHSGGGEYKLHLWIFTELVPAKQMRSLLEKTCRESGIMPNEIFPKQDYLEENGFGNLVKLPLGKNLTTGMDSSILDEDFKPITEMNKIVELLQFHLKNKSMIPLTEQRHEHFIIDESDNKGCRHEPLTKKKDFFIEWKI